MANTRTRQSTQYSAPVRRTGARTPAVNAAPPTNVKSLLKPIKSFFRADYGGKNPGKIIADRLAAAGIEATPEAVAAYKLAAKQTRDGISARVTPRLDAVDTYLG